MSFDRISARNAGDHAAYFGVFEDRQWCEMLVGPRLEPQLAVPPGQNLEQHVSVVEGKDCATRLYLPRSIDSDIIAVEDPRKI